MNKKNKKARVAYQQIFAYLQKFGIVQPYHQSFIKDRGTVKHYSRNEGVYLEGHSDRTIFFNCSGLLARVIKEDNEKTQKEKRRILSVCLPNMVLTSTEHLYTNKQLPGDIIALQPSVVIEFSYSSILAFKEEDQLLNSMISALSNKMNKQLGRLRLISFIKDPMNKYLEFTKYLPELREVLSQNEQQDLLDISRSTIQRTSFFLVKGIKRR